MTYAQMSRNGLILTNVIRPYVSERVIARDFAAGHLVRVRRGAYVERDRWHAATLTERHVLRVHAVAAMSSRPVIFGGLSAAALWGMPVKSAWPVDVVVLAPPECGGRSAPGVRRTSTGFSSAALVNIGGVTATNLARTALDVARGCGLTDAIGSVDWALWRKNPMAISKDDLAVDLQRMQLRAGRSHLQRVVEFATSLSDSFYESAARAVIHMLGFAPPELQVQLRDARGVMYPDYLWRDARIAGEFDGKEKYMRGVYFQGTPGETVWQEKKREDRLRALDLRVVRILTEHVENPRLLESLLISAGVPRTGLAAR
jgi:hypothetical protein